MRFCLTLDVSTLEILFYMTLQRQCAQKELNVEHSQLKATINPACYESRAPPPPHPLHTAPWGTPASKQRAALPVMNSLRDLKQPRSNQSPHTRYTLRTPNSPSHPRRPTLTRPKKKRHLQLNTTPVHGVG